MKLCRNICMVFHYLLHQSYIYSSSKPIVYLMYQMAAIWLSNITWYAQCTLVYSASTPSSQSTHPVCFIIHLKINCLFIVSAYLKENSFNIGTWCWPWQPRCDLCSILYRKIPVSGISYPRKETWNIFRNLYQKSGTFGERMRHILKVRFSTNELPLVHMQVL